MAPTLAAKLTDVGAALYKASLCRLPGAAPTYAEGNHYAADLCQADAAASSTPVFHHRCWAVSILKYCEQGERARRRCVSACLGPARTRNLRDGAPTKSAEQHLVGTPSNFAFPETQPILCDCPDVAKLPGIRRRLRLSGMGWPERAGGWGGWMGG